MNGPVETGGWKKSLPAIAPYPKHQAIFIFPSLHYLTSKAE